MCIVNGSNLISNIIWAFCKCKYYFLNFSGIGWSIFAEWFLFIDQFVLKHKADKPVNTEHLWQLKGYSKR